jgi:predicted NAD/FAD-binding protein
MHDMNAQPEIRQTIAVIGSGISGLSCAWLLSGAHHVTLYERAARLGGHTNTVLAPNGGGDAVPVDTGFIVYNEKTYPNLTAMFTHLRVETRGTDMSFAVSLRGGGLEYGSTSLRGLFAQKRNLVSPRFWAMLLDLMRFYRTAPLTAQAAHKGLTLGDYLDANGYGRAFQEDHLLPQAAAIWSASPGDIRSFPAESFIRFFDNHGLLELDVQARPQWRTVVGGSARYIDRLLDGSGIEVVSGAPVTSIARSGSGVTLHQEDVGPRRFDRVVLATHADEALRLLADPTDRERDVLGAFRYTRNTAVLHTDIRLMPRRKAAWSAWNYVGEAGGAGEVTYWMNLLQGLDSPEPLLVSLNPLRSPLEDRVIRTELYEHPLFDRAAIDAQRRLWSLQGARRTYFCGAYFGSGFHEDGLQSGLAVAEAIGGVRRPWSVKDESGRIQIDTAPTAAVAA